MKKKYFNIFSTLFLLVTVVGMSQVQIGQDLLGGGVWSNMALSPMGNIVATPYGSSTKVYEEISGVWTQIGQDIPMGAFSISLSSYGNIVAIGNNADTNVNGASAGAVGVYEFDMGVWKQKGQQILGKTAEEQSGFSISLSSNGNMVAIGAPYKAWQGDIYNPSGTVRVYNYSNLSGSWNQVGQDIDGQGFGDYSGTGISLSGNGKVLAIGTIFEGLTGVVRVYNNINGVWFQIGSTIHSVGGYSRFGRSVSLSVDGSVLAIGGYRRNGLGILRGHVRLYKNVSGVWKQIGNDIEGEADYEQVGFGVSLSADGSTVAVGGLMDATGQVPGGTRVYKNISNVWTKVYNDINFGFYVSLSAGGERVAVKGVGKTQVYDLTKASSSNHMSEVDFKIYPNPATDILNISLNGNLILEKVIIYNNLGQVVKTTNHTVINIDHLSPGVYFVEVSTNHGRDIKKLIVK